ncbi:MAG: choice-of-anchor D domain-containing protein [Chloroflexota bacterium]
MASRLRAGFALLAAFALAASWSGALAPAARATALDPLSITPSPAEFGPVYWGTNFGIDETITNISAGSVTLDVVEISTNTAEYVIIPGGTCALTSQVLAAAASCTVKVAFIPVTKGAVSDGFLHIGSVSAGEHYIALHGTGLDAILEGSPPDFMGVLKGSTSAPQVVAMQNVGLVTVNPATATISGTNAGDFAKVPGQDSCSGQALVPTASCSVAVTFHPTAFGVRTATLTISGPSPIGDRVFTLTGTGLAPASSVAWGATRIAGPNFTWNDGASLGRTVKGSTQQLHLAYATDVVGGKVVTDKGPYAGIYYLHATTGTTWAKPVRLNPAKQHGARPTLAAAGSRVYAVWVSEKHWVAFTETEPRALYVRVNTNHGAPTAWKPAKLLTSLTGRIDFPIVAASGTDVHIAWTDSITGRIRVATSRNKGTSWTIRTIGTTTFTFGAASSHEGVPYVAVSGANVIVAWVADNAGRIVVSSSGSHGTTWSKPVAIVSSSYETFSTAIRGTRAAVTWSDATGIVTRVRTGGTWKAARVVAPATGYDQFSPAVVLQDTNRIAVSWAQAGADPNAIPVLWEESPNNGVSWYQPQTVATTSSATHTGNDYASVLWPAAGTRLVAYNGWNAADTSYRLYYRVGTGTPKGLAAPAPLAVTTSQAAAAGLTVHRGGPAAAR